MVHAWVCFQLKRAKALCAKRMQYIGGSEYSCYVDFNEVPLQKKVRLHSLCWVFVSHNLYSELHHFVMCCVF